MGCGGRELGSGWGGLIAGRLVGWIQRCRDWKEEESKRTVTERDDLASSCVSCLPLSTPTARTASTSTQTKYPLHSADPLSIPTPYTMSKAPTRPIAFFDVSIGNTPAGRIKMELFSDVVPKTAENFRQLCTGEHRVNHMPIGYKNSIFHRVIPNFMCQGGDFINGDGTGSTSIYGPQFDDENFEVKHDAAGLLSMANSGPGTNGCQFFITTTPAPFLDGKHTVFGKVLGQDSMLVVRKIENVATGPNNRPKLPVTITECGEM
ncbi:BQ5605_C034g11277 [Microbotryum silenes-dioicae]|uniref:Peptidyl-prolyl cis-trans isomerase n=1 Tax=Microbotryum silenes-dioicae TaxID=796604 RepID=A0A2X0PGY1_9BASI|nr:BQ5605_C034g11277 [Microbotryum silenes-dioicae]